MSKLTRRSMLKWGLATAAATTAGQRTLWAADEKPYDLGFPVVGKVKPVPSKAIAASPLSVGFETLDRRHFDPEKTYPRLAELGVKWARCQTGWNRCERVRGQFDFAWLDEVVNSLLEIGVQPWFNLGYGNKLYTPEKPNDGSVGWAPVFDAKAREAWLRFTRAIAEHFRDRVRCWEIWNEPNISGFWKPKKPNAKDYVALVKITAGEIRRKVPEAVIVGGALAGIPMGYLKGCLEAGLAQEVDRISYHPYRSVPEANYDKEIRDLRKLIGSYKKEIDIWQGENGCPSRGGPESVGALSNLDWNERRQAKWLLRRILGDLRLDVELTSYFHLVDLVGYRGKTNFKGLLRGKDYRPKPSFFAYQCLCALFDSKTKRLAKLNVEPIGQEKVHLQDAGFARNGRALYAWWYPANLLQPWQPRRLNVRISTPPEATIQEPVLIDPLTSQVHRLQSARRDGDSLILENLPLVDYPLLLTDRTVAGHDRS